MDNQKKVVTPLLPIAVLRGDGGADRVTQMVLNVLFPDLPTTEVSMSVDARLKTKDACIGPGIAALRVCGGGFKCSTASDDQRIKDAKLKSLNVQMRNQINAHTAIRITRGPGKYGSVIQGVARLMTGGIYEEQSAVEVEDNGRVYLETTNRMDLKKLNLFAHQAYKTAKEHDLQLVLLSKSTICETEARFRRDVERVWNESYGLVSGTDYMHFLTDLGMAELPIACASGPSRMADGGFLYVGNCADGDTASDIIDRQHGDFLMTSTVYCEGPNDTQFSYDELTAGTANDKATGDLVGANFYSPVSIILGIANAVEAVNPSEAEYCQSVRHAAVLYLAEGGERDTVKMLAQIARTCEKEVIA